MSEILKLFMEKGFLLDKEMLEFLNELDDGRVASEIIDKIAVVSHKKVITKNLVDDNIEKIKPLLVELDGEKRKLVDKYFVNISISVEVKKERGVEDEEVVVDASTISGSTVSSNINVEKEIERGSVKILSSPIGVSKKIECRDFVKHFRNRYNGMKKLLQERPELDNLISIDKISGNNDISIIGIVSEKRITKNGNLILNVEDLTGKARLLINQNKEDVFEKSKEILLDDIIGFNCNGDREFLFVNDFFYPDCFLKEKRRLDEEDYAIFISDLHIGSGNFLAENFGNFIDWLNGKDCDEGQKEVLKRIKYMFVVGDTIDGVGVYPGQEKDLVVKDIKEQYKILAEFYERIPKHISIIQCAGQHDAVRVAEPQPPVGEDFAECLQDIENLYLVSNPSFVEIGGEGNGVGGGGVVDKGEVVGESGEVSGGGEDVVGESGGGVGGEGKEGIKVLMYHGASMHGMIGEIEELRLNKAHAHPARVIKHILLRRHLAPTHGATTYIPNSSGDPMLISEVPDVITTGDLHRTDIDSYNNVLIVANSCWQAMTAFEEKVGNNPDPCKVPILNLKTRAIKILDFSDGDEGEGEEVEGGEDGGSSNNGEDIKEVKNG
tara:strand:+ start:17625 stop:19448 length:1824 start_codon:yes stop_codon:yes gene_type:complete